MDSQTTIVGVIALLAAVLLLLGLLSVYDGSQGVHLKPLNPFQ
jgi:hypothetical protein